MDQVEEVIRQYLRVINTGKPLSEELKHKSKVIIRYCASYPQLETELRDRLGDDFIRFGSKVFSQAYVDGNKAWER